LTEELKSYNVNLEKLVKEKTQDALQAKERELFSVMLQKTETDNLLNEIYNWLDNAQGKSIEKERVLNDLIIKVKNKLGQNETEKQLLQFEKIHPNFFESLQIAHPSLSQNEIKLSAYLKLNLTYKDIGRILNVQPESVRKAKSRMRQKMGLESDKDIKDYLRSF
jgi:DNA-binding CsgD family transcriptional regulator